MPVPWMRTESMHYFSVERFQAFPLRRLKRRSEHRMALPTTLMPSHPFTINVHKLQCSHTVCLGPPRKELLPVEAVELKPLAELQCAKTMDQNRTKRSQFTDAEVELALIFVWYYRIRKINKIE